MTPPCSTQHSTPSYDKITLSKGNYQTPEKGHCVMEVVSLLSEEPFSDHPACAGHTIIRFAQALNDSAPTQEARDSLLELVPLIMDSKGSIDLERRRVFRLADFAVREMAPIALDVQKRPQDAAKLRSLPPITNRKTALAGKSASTAAADAAYAASTAAAYAASTAAAYAASTAAADAAYAFDAAADAAYAFDAAAYAASTAADAAAHAAAAKMKIWVMRFNLLRELCEMEDP